jgi:hypothetical protein
MKAMFGNVPECLHPSLDVGAEELAPRPIRAQFESRMF